MIISLLLVFLPVAVWGAVRAENHLVWAALALFMGARVLTLGSAASRFLKAEGT
jgi:hypothetical protein